MEKEEYIKQLAKTYKWKEERIRGVYEVCEKYGVEPYGNIFLRTPQDAEAIILMLKNRGVNADCMKMAFRRTAEDVDLILKICDKFNITVESSLFYKYPNELLEAIRYVGVNFGRKYLKASIITKDLDNLKRSMPALKKFGLLKYLGRETGVLDLTEEEIKERTAIIMYVGAPIHKRWRYSREDTLNHIYSLSKERYEEYIEENLISEKVRKYQVDLLEEKLKLREEEKQ